MYNANTVYVIPDKCIYGQFHTLVILILEKHINKSYVKLFAEVHIFFLYDKPFEGFVQIVQLLTSSMIRQYINIVF